MTQQIRHILVVEDEDMIANLLLTVLEASGFQVTTCADTASAMTQLAHGTFDATLVDLTLPDGPPDRVIDALRARNVPVIVISGDPDRLARYPDLPALSKPFRMKALLARLEACLAEGMPTPSIP
ncbi:response regulator transcription factor [Novacetimonas pomaceti]|uniref:DNA-binding response regulator n=1 Tax=Novacetimonas pomaceti TaxID=2021998 RepID=A0A318QGU6_9PROT|nr:response regulator [Novacetimonas pomaceti]MBV1832989.1 response regulator [Novacetimonas pomaceti]PYD47800.1 DNA-binding response regulator [Novacetimonas pomaceti]PYD77114.1 hypothetical protein CFR71_01960 [Novacetimonas pomaceti]